jgi:hypothetical protein
MHESNWIPHTPLPPIPEYKIDMSLHQGYCLQTCLDSSFQLNIRIFNVQWINDIVERLIHKLVMVVLRDLGRG